MPGSIDSLFLGTLGVQIKVPVLFINFWPSLATGLSYLRLHNSNKNHGTFINFGQNWVTGLLI